MEVAFVIFDLLQDDIDSLRSHISFLSRIEHHEVIILSLALLLFASAVDSISAARRKKAEAKRQAELPAE